MSPIDITRIEQQARQLRAEEMQRINGLVAARLRLYVQLLAATALSGAATVAAILRPLFSWNPQQAAAADRFEGQHRSLLSRLNSAMRWLFSWNPQAHRSH
jgi:hypothetical protein